MKPNAEETPSVSDVTEGDVNTVDAAANALFARWKAAGGLPEDETGGEPEPKEPETPREPVEEESKPTEEPEEEPEAPEEKPAEKIAEDDAFTTVKVGEDEYRVAVKDLKRLYGQEQALTKKSQEVAQQRKATEEQGQRYATALTTLVSKAQKRWEPYAKLDWMVLSQRTDPDTLATLRKDAQEAFEDYKFLVEEIDGHMTAAQQAHQTKLAEQAKEAVKALKNPESPHHIEGWSDDVYQSIITFAIDHGVPAEAINTETNPAVIKFLWMAQQYTKAKQEAAKVKSTKPVTKGPARVLKPGTGKAEGPKEVKRVEALERLRKSGDLEDAADAFLAKWGTTED